MTTVLLAGRRLPHQDWEGDDFTPGAGGAFVTCTDTAAGRALAYASNGRQVLDGRTIRAAVHPHDPDGINLPQAKRAIEALTTTTIILPQTWHWAELLAHLRARKAAIIQLWYASIPRTYREQASASFGHAVWVSHDSVTSGCRTWDALDANETHHGQWIPARYIRAAAEEWSRRNGATHLYVGYIPLQHL
jgi:GNAT superfamily N-acetyltransferase